MNEELEKAYEADKERKQVKTDELQAARDYVGVLLNEAEGRNAELKDKNEQADALKARLDERENDYAQLSIEHSREKNKAKLARFWMFFGLGELLVIVVLAVIMIAGSFRTHKNTEKNGTEQGSSSTDTVPADQEIPDALPETVKQRDDLAVAVESLNHDPDSLFKASVETVDGLEYLVFKHSKLKVCYKNEYYADEKSYSKCMLIDNGNARYSFEKNYDLTGDLSGLVPVITNADGIKMLAFAEYADKQTKGFPQKLTLIDYNSFRIYTQDYPAELISAMLKVEQSSDVSVYEDAPVVYDVTTPVASYKFAIAENYYNEIAYNGYHLPDVESEAEFRINTDGMSWETLVKLGDDLYMGKATGGFTVKDSGIVVSNAKFGAFVPNNQEDPKLNGIIRTADAVPERYLTISGYNSERFFVAVDEAIPECKYDWERLNTEDPNDWKYFDGDGNQVSIRGIDVSKYQGKIDWKKVAEAGVEFAIVRLGFRGMNQGTLEMDPYYNTNMKNALANGIKVGVYFFSQAVDEKEALEEADYVINALKDYKLEYPVIFDTERVTTFDARANGLGMDERTSLCKVFCDRIREAGYVPMIYANTKYMVMGIDLKQLEGIDLWFAVYSDKITYPYHFDMLQYSESGSIPGVTGQVDLNISFVDYSVK
ncbi:MAG: hypothetical protein K6G81_04145 [Lachnospiraceae bacterium]|nr:hypothetical protein [Lachnospiraceae bacterium]